MKLLTILASVGAINWGLTVFGFNLVDALLGEGSIFSNAVYIIVALAGVGLLLRLAKCSQCGGSCDSCDDKKSCTVCETKEAK